MTQRVVLWGATGYTGRLVAQALAALPLPVTLAGRDETRLRRLRDELPGAAAWSVAVADSARHGSLREVIDQDSVVIATVGPFTRLGWPAALAAAESGAAYVDSTGEPPFIRRVHDWLAVTAARSGAVLAPAFGYDFVPGQVAAAHALEDAPRASAVRVGYFTPGSRSTTWLSAGTRASIASVVIEPSYAWREGRLRHERPAARVASLRVGDRMMSGVSIGGAEHLFLPRSYPGLRDVDVYLGWAAGSSRVVAIGSAVMAPVTRLPGLREVVDRATRRLVPGSTGGPSAEERRQLGTLVVADALSAEGEVVGRAEMSGPNPYDLTASLLALAAERLADDPTAAPAGVVGPLELFGVKPMLELASGAGLSRTA